MPRHQDCFLPAILPCLIQVGRHFIGLRVLLWLRFLQELGIGFYLGRIHLRIRHRRGSLSLLPRRDRLRPVESLIRVSIERHEGRTATDHVAHVLLALFDRFKPLGQIQLIKQRRARIGNVLDDLSSGQNL